MEVDNIDLAALLSEPTGSGIPALPDDLDDLFSEELMQFLHSDNQQLEPQPVKELPPAPQPVLAAAVPTSSCSSQSSEGGATAPASPVVSPAPQPMFAAGLAGLPVPGLVPRLVTTTQAQVWAAMLQAAYCAPMQTPLPAPAAAPIVDEAKVRSAQAAVTSSRQASRQASRASEQSDDSSDSDQDDHEMVDSKKPSNKRKAPEVDWRQIEDPAERRRQRRLAKNRVTAARSRERKKAMWSELEDKLKNMETENMQLRAMLETFARENTTLKNQLLHMSRANGAAGVSEGRVGKTMDPAVVLPVIIVTMLVACSLLSSDKAVALFCSVVPMLLMAGVVGPDGAVSSASFSGLLQAMAQLCSRFAKSGRAARRMLFDRHRYLGRRAMLKLGAAGVTTLLRDPGEAKPSSSAADGHSAAPSPSLGEAAATEGSCDCPTLPDAAQTPCSIAIKQEPVC
ncbi:hypothetical protein HYH03_018558 [Edaphochlamys debaryana]|uniref:BZIP domain-containing protein n=1 Tax=Edaphochlamys debaryana TaxID=47281 RepID=A0A835XGT0_9CHLO|nr:hypothetical protein HYH03_018558 [Edaphochlamys debaryana]|eukprot:KAG2482513.1 hypothetical protein HYH03_018558 [Edaphochlamys debaryana]